jgi:hypothetical protein
MNRIKRLVQNEYFLVYLFSLAVVIGPAISILFAQDLSLFPDCKTYLGLAAGDFDQSPVRRYRPIVPLLAGGLNYLFGGVFRHLAPSYYTGDFSLPFSFFLVNTGLFGLYSVLIYRYCKAYAASWLTAAGGILVMLTSRYTAYYAGLALVDSLFFVVIAMVLLGIKLKDSRLLILAIFIGPFAKEAFIFIAPLIFFFSHINKAKQLFYFLLSGVLVFSFRYMYEYLGNFPVNIGLKVDMQHIPNIKLYLPVLFSFQGIYKVVSSMALWMLLPLIAWWLVPGFGKLLKSKLEGYMLFFLLSVLLQMLLSGSMERMFYEAMPLVCMIAAISFETLRKAVEIGEK